MIIVVKIDPNFKGKMMSNPNISALFHQGADGETKRVAITISAEADAVAASQAHACRISKARWLELLVEGTIREYGMIGEAHAAVPKDMVSPGRMGADQGNGENDGSIRSGFHSLYSDD